MPAGCETTDTAGQGSKSAGYCHFPFVFKGKIYSGCTMDNPPGTTGNRSGYADAWCGVWAVLDEDSNKWGTCKMGGGCQMGKATTYDIQGEATECPRLLPEPYSNDHSAVYLHHGSGFSEGSQKEITCAAGYVHSTSGNSAKKNVLTCRKDGTRSHWVSSVPNFRCTKDARSCDPLVTNVQGYKTVGGNEVIAGEVNSLLHGATAVQAGAKRLMTCAAGFLHPSGKEMSALICKNGQWA